MKFQSIYNILPLQMTENKNINSVVFKKLYITNKFKIK